MEKGEFKPYDVTDIFVRRLGSSYMKVTGTFIGHKPNSFHKWVAEKLVEGKFPAIATTNFDCSIEDALQEMGIKLIELTGDAQEDRQLFDTTRPKNGEVVGVIVSNFDAFAVLGGLMSMIGRKSHFFILKVHGCAKHSRSCVDTAAQRAQGLPWSVSNVLSSILQRFPMFFMGFGGGDLDRDMNYLRLRSERDSARVYWLFRPGDTEPSVFDLLRTNLGSKFNIVYSQIPGKITGQNPLLAEKMAAWAKGFGPFWTRLCLIDLAEAAHFPKEIKDQLLAPLLGSSSKISKPSVSGLIKRFQTPSSPSKTNDESKGEEEGKILGDTNLNILIQKNPEINEESKAQLSVCSNFDQALSYYKQGELLLALQTITKAIIEQRKFFPDSRFYIESCFPMILYALCLEAIGDLENAKTAFLDAHSISIISGNLEGQELLEKIFKQKDYLKVIESKDSTPQPILKSSVDENEVIAFIPIFDNVGDFMMDIPLSMFLRAQLHRGLLVADKLAIALNFLLNSKVFVSEVLFEKGEHLNEEYLYFIRPLIPTKQSVNKNGTNTEINLKESPTPLLTYRLECQVNNPAYLHESIEISYIEKIDQFYQQHPELIYWYDFKAIAGSYASRVSNLLQHNKTIDYFPDDQKPYLQEVLEPTLNFVKGCLTGGYLTRSQLYKFGNLFKEPTSSQAFEKEFGPLIEKLGQAETREIIEKAREKFEERPWIYSSALYDIADSPYTTNLPLAFGFSLCVDKNEERFFRFISPILSEEEKGISLDPLISISSFRSIELSRLQIKQLLNLRNSSQSQEFRRELRQYSTPKREKILELTKNYNELLKPYLIPVDQRPLPKINLEQTLSNNFTLDLEIASHLRMYISASAHIQPTFQIPMLSFPNLMPTLKSSTKTEEKNTIQQLEEILEYSSPANKWVKLYFDRVKFPNGVEGRYNVIVENDGVPGVVILPISTNSNGEIQIGMIYTYRYPIKSWSWEVPRGGGDINLTPFQSAMKEMEEETNFTCSDAKLKELTGSGIFHNNGISNSNVFYFAAEGVHPLNKSNIGPEETEVIQQFKFFTLKEVLEMIHEGKIQDSFTLIALSLAHLHKIIQLE